MRFAVLVVLCIGSLALGCTGGMTSQVPQVSKPSLYAISSQSIHVGEAISFLGAAFSNDGGAYVEVELQGVFKTTAGQSYNVSQRVRPHYQDGNTLVVTNFGPFACPFSPTGNELGTFSGFATAIGRVAKSDVEARSESLPVSISIEPSLVIHKFQPKDNADCPSPTKRLLGGYQYVIDVEAVGFTPINFSYVISGEPGVPVPRIQRHQASGNMDHFGQNGDFFLLQVPTDIAFYTANLSVQALGTDGQTRSVSLTYGVHRPLEVVTTGGPFLAEVEAPTPQTGCRAGGQFGAMFTWTETMEESRSRTVNVEWNQSWVMSHGVNGSQTQTNQTNVSVSDSSTDGWQSGWSDTNGTDHSEGTGVNAGVSVDPSAFGVMLGTVSAGINHDWRDSVNHSHGTNFEQNHSDTHSYTVGHDYSQSDTEGYSYEQSQTLQNGGGNSDTVTTSMSNAASTQVTVVPGYNAMVYRQATRFIYPGVIVQYDLCGNATPVAKTSYSDWLWSVSVDQAQACPPPPSLPAKQCLIPPCGG